MKIAITAQGTELSSPVDPRFGRAAYILVVDTDSLEFEVLDNAVNVNAFKGAGIKAATGICEKDAEVLMTGYCGPKAFATLDAAGIKVVSDIQGKVQDAVELFNCGNIIYTDTANTDGHW